MPAIQAATLTGLHPTISQLAIIAGISAIGGGINSIAGGGTLLTFPALVGLGIPGIVANATSTVALWPGSLASLTGYRKELVGARQWALRLAIPSLLGGLAGAFLLLATSEERFKLLVPWLVFGATVLFAVQKPAAIAIARRLERLGLENVRAVHPSMWMLLLQFLTAIYGGYFGAGAGIVMLAAYGLMGFTNIHQMNGLKNFNGLFFNGIAAATFALKGFVNWPIA
ncbi:MAG: sulfite exporter TauE/SafE family protein, partial [Gemmatimonadaceae bacterium]